MPCILFDAVPTFHQASPRLGDVDARLGWSGYEQAYPGIYLGSPCIKPHSESSTYSGLSQNGAIYKQHDQFNAGNHAIEGLMVGRSWR